MTKRLDSKEQSLIDAFVAGKLRLDELPDELHEHAWEAAVGNTGREPGQGQPADDTPGQRGPSSAR